MILAAIFAVIVAGAHNEQTVQSFGGIEAYNAAQVK
jgi:hypothetical protein